MRGNRLLATLMLCLSLVWATGCALPWGGSHAPEAELPAEDAVASDEAPASDDPLDGITADSRVVALSRSLGDLWLLAGGQLVGITEDGMSLDGLPEDVESIGTVTEPDEDKVLELKPDLVILSPDLVSQQELTTTFTSNQIPVLLVAVDSFEDYEQVMEAFTGATGRDDLYQQNVADVRAKIDDIIANGAVTDESTYMVLRVAGSTGEMLSEDSFVCSILDDMGLVNAAPDGSVLGIPSIEDLTQINPDRIFVVFQGDEAEADLALKESYVMDPAWKELTAVKNSRVVVLPKNLFQYKPNAKWAEAYSYISQVLHGSWA